MEVKFSHLADCHLGSWRQQELQDLNFQSFQKALATSIEEKVDFILIAGDLFDSAYPPIEILKETFAEFKKIKDAGIPIYLIAGSHDFSASGKTFLDVLEKAGFCKNVEQTELLEDGSLKLKPTFFKEIAIYGYPGRKSGMEMEDLQKVKFDSVYPFSIFMLHTTISDIVGNIPMASIDKMKLPLANYYAFGHIHKRFQKEEPNGLYVYPGPIYPNNFQELADLKCGSFNITTVKNGGIKTKSVMIPLKEVVYLELEISNALIATENIISAIDKLSLVDKIFLLKLKGVLNQGKTGDIRFNEIEDFVIKKQAHVFLRNISALKIEETDIEVDASDVENIEEKIIEEYSEKNPADYNKLLPQLMSALSLEKIDDEKSLIFENRLMNDLTSLLKLEGIL